MSAHRMRATGRASARRRAWPLAAALLACSALPACQRTESVPPTAAVVTPAPGRELPAVPASGADTSVPDAGRVLAREEAAASAPGSGEPTSNQKSDVTREQESKSMPLPGQANDHSNTAGDKKPDAPKR